jgi:hypothetical protein
VAMSNERSAAPSPPPARGSESRLGLAAAQRIGSRLFISANTILSAAEKARRSPARSPDPPHDSKRVACFSPYATWDIVSAWELTVLDALARRGCDTRLMFCDAVSPMCDLAWVDKDPPWDRCVVCQNRATQAARLLRHPFEWLSRYIDTADRATATAWAESLPGDGLREARFGDDALGDWCVSTVLSHFRDSRLDLESPEVQHVYRDYLKGAALTLVGCRRWLESIGPDTLWLFNGRLSLTRVAFEAARGLGIRVICHERGIVRHSLRLWENEPCSRYRGRRAFALDHSIRPLTATQAGDTLAWFADRRASRNWNRKPFLAKRPRNTAKALADAGVTNRDGFLLVLTSSDNEFAAEAARNRIFPEQHAWLAAVLGWAADHPASRVVIRFHPNTGPASWKYTLTKLSLDCGAGEDTPVMRPTANVSIVPPANPLDTYALIDACAAVTTYGTTAGIEAAAVGKIVIVADECLYHGMPWARSAESPAHFLELLDQVPRGGVPPADHDVAAGGLRFMWDYHLAPSITSRLVRHPGIDYARTSHRANVPAELDYGNDSGLDRITDVILGRRPIDDPRPPVDGAAERAAVLAHLRSSAAV